MDDINRKPPTIWRVEEERGAGDNPIRAWVPPKAARRRWAAVKKIAWAMAISCGGSPHQSSGPFLGRALLDASNSTTQLINYSLGIKGKASRSEARRRDLSDERGAPTIGDRLRAKGRSPATGQPRWPHEDLHNEGEKKPVGRIPHSARWLVFSPGLRKVTHGSAGSAGRFRKSLLSQVR